ncbi:hypothetical protein MHU86_19388 [Fragilaria crotonensis]|nr:hypothetical protein MHU86_19388 [Fragilaria crotonensis]
MLLLRNAVKPRSLIQVPSLIHIPLAIPNPKHSPDSSTRYAYLLQREIARLRRVEYLQTRDSRLMNHIMIPFYVQHRWTAIWHADNGERIEIMSTLVPWTTTHQQNRTLRRVSTVAIVLALVTPCVSFQPPLEFHPLQQRSTGPKHFIYFRVATTHQLHAKTHARADDFQSGDKRNTKRLRQSNLHPRNIFQGSYDMDQLCRAYPRLAPFLRPGHSTKGDRRLTIDFSDPDAVRTLNAALLAHHYGIQHWQEYLLPFSLIPPVPGRADYIHHIADVLASSSSIHNDDDTPVGSNTHTNKNSHVGFPNVPVGPTIRGLDIGTGASMIYPLLGTRLYGWSFLASEIDPKSQAAARQIASAAFADDNDDDNERARHDDYSQNCNTNGDDSTLGALYKTQKIVDIRLQTQKTRILDGILMDDDEDVDFCMCNPPFYTSQEAYQKESLRKIKNLHANQEKRKTKSGLAGSRVMSSSILPSDSFSGSNNFAGGASELWCPGGEVAFLLKYIHESRSSTHSKKCLWFSSLVSRRDNLVILLKALNNVDRMLMPVYETRVVEMGQGQKTSSILFWTFQNRMEQKQWSTRRKWHFVRPG